MDFNKNPTLNPFFPLQEIDHKTAETFWEDDGDKNEQFEQNLWETIGANDVTIGLDEFVRILVNYRKVSAPGFEMLKEAFNVIGAKGGMVDKQTFQTALTTLGEPLTVQELIDFIKLLSDKGLPIQQLPDHLSAEEFGKKYL